MATIPPYLFDEFFASGKEESISPFLTPASRKWGKNLPLKTAILSACLLLGAFLSYLLFPPLFPLLLLFVYFFAGTPALIGALEDLKNFEINIDVLMTLAALLSILIGSGLEGALLLVLFELSAAMETMVSEKTKGTLFHLHQLAPRFATLLGDDGSIFSKAISEVSIGTSLLIKAGEIIPLDGSVTHGSSFVNLIHLTGESIPCSKRVGDEVQAGSRNLDGTLTVKVTRTSRDSTLSRIIQLVTQAQEAKPKLERFLNRFGKWYALTIMTLFFLFAGLMPLFFSMPYLGGEGSIYRALAFLIAASPCALILATPTAYLSALSSCARCGILLKGGIVLDAIARCKRIAFDKTGTLTTGRLKCTSLTVIHPGHCTKTEAIAIAAALERHTVHPIADAIVAFAQAQGITPVELIDFKAVPGYGLEGKVRLHTQVVSTHIGHSAFIHSLLPPSLNMHWEKLRKQLNPSEGQLMTLLLVDDALFSFHFLDEIRPESARMVDELLHTQFTPLMLTGDRHTIANAVAHQVGISEVYADLRPEDKLQAVAALADTSGLIMVGDGVNDAPALSRATVGISMGKIGSATAIDASDVIFLNDDLSLLTWLIHKSQRTVHIVKQNITLALLVICCASIPALLGVVPLWIAVLLHEGGSVLVGLNSLRLLRK